ncbi:TetR/AcrR family transcriptional regulator [Salinispira pacifica]|uniref:Transcriptional regulator, TetR family n=1 Tax=Salinispira pacifica TaxID=1307761 RepID=V5WH37_9SPIO|nr:TetR/AcrR family transcriptional regulator [Salinispira pacifica]AHC15098.1 Transcriptional regulator, TetR family [Salinispira pacifica]
MGRKPQSEASKQRKIESILKTAQEMILETSYDGVKISELARRSGMAKGTVFLYFPTKEEIFFSLFTHSIRSWFHRFGEALEAQINAGITLDVEIFLQELFESLNDVPHLPRMMVLLHSRIAPGLEQREEYSDFQIQILDAGGELLESYFSFLEKGVGAAVFGRILASLSGLETFGEIWAGFAIEACQNIQDPLLQHSSLGDAEHGKLHALDFYIQTVRRILKGYSIQ